MVVSQTAEEILNMSGTNPQGGSQQISLYLQGWRLSMEASQNYSARLGTLLVHVKVRVFTADTEEGPKH